MFDHWKKEGKRGHPPRRRHCLRRQKKRVESPLFEAEKKGRKNAAKPSHHPKGKGGEKESLLGRVLPRKKSGLKLAHRAFTRKEENT